MSATEHGCLLSNSQIEECDESGNSNQEMSENRIQKVLKYSSRTLIAIGIFTLGLLVAASFRKDHSPNALKSSDSGKETRNHRKGKKNDDTIGGSCGDQLEFCEDKHYSRNTLKTAYDMPFSALFQDSRGQKKFEASDVIVVDGSVYAVCDSSWAISKFSSSLQPFSAENVQIGNPAREEEDSGYEAILHDDGVFYVVRESVWHDHKRRQSVGTYRAVIEELIISKDDYEVRNKCSSEFEFDGDSKGFEGAISIRDAEGDLVILALCEGNFCKEHTNDHVGNGRIVAMKKNVQGDGTCTWKTIRQIAIPESASFRDYSSIALNEDGRVAVSSQENSAVWFGKLKGRLSDGLWSLNEVAFDDDGHKVYHFPKDSSCNTVYCNVEGIHWLDGNMLLAVSDKMKKKGRQNFRCFDKDQSVHVMVLP